MTLTRAAALISPDLTPDKLPFLWFACTECDPRDPEQMQFLRCDVDRRLGLTREQFMRAVTEIGFELG